jgi:hypothetical protein
MTRSGLVLLILLSAVLAEIGLMQSGGALARSSNDIPASESAIIERFLKKDPQYFLGRKRTAYMEEINEISNEELIRLFLDTALGSENSKADDSEDTLYRWVVEYDAKITIQNGFNTNHGNISLSLMALLNFEWAMRPAG